MDNIIVVIFENEEKAFDGIAALKDLHHDGRITLYAHAMIERGENGKVTVKEKTSKGPRGTAAGMITGALVGLLGGPLGSAFGSFIGTLGGMIYDLAKVGVSDDFIAEVGQSLVPGRTAVVAEVWEEWITPVDTRMADADGVVFRRGVNDLLGPHIERDAAVLRAEISGLEAEMDNADEQAKVTLQDKLVTAKSKLRATRERAKASLKDAQSEMDAKIASLNEQMTKANADTRAKLEKRIAEIKADFKLHSELLGQAMVIANRAPLP